MASRRLSCHGCGEWAEPGREMAVYLYAEDDEPVTVAFCSDACEDASGIESCARCGRYLECAVDWVDLRDPRAYNFVRDGGGDKICIRCAGIDREDLDWWRHEIVQCDG
ncbi:MAG: hypothetical protein K6U87_11145 [Firmicutes bacterium]|nr:hypothetical protein [Bacillota bacterium]